MNNNDEKERYHCVQCKKELTPVILSIYSEALVCLIPECPNYGLLQAGIEKKITVDKMRKVTIKEANEIEKMCTD